MRIYAVADIHGRAERLKRIKENILTLNPDVLVIAGDITNFTGFRPVIDRLQIQPRLHTRRRPHQGAVGVTPHARPAGHEVPAVVVDGRPPEMGVKGAGRDLESRALE